MDADEFGRFVRQKARANFEADGSLTPVLLAMVPGKGLTITIVSHMDRDETAQLIKRLRLTSPLLAMVAEAWTVEVGATPTPAQPAAAGGIPPSEHPDRREAVIVTIFSDLGVVDYTAEIIRSDGEKPRLGPWEVPKVVVEYGEGRPPEHPPEGN